MAGATKTTKTFSLDRELLRMIEETRGGNSTSERVNQLLKAGIDAERRNRLEREVAEFFKSGDDDRSDRAAFQSASIKALARE